MQISRWESEDLKIARRELHVNYRGILDQIAFVEDPVGLLHRIMGYSYFFYTDE